MRIEDDAGLSELLRSSEEARLCSGFQFTEGPLWVASDHCLLFSDIPGNRMHRWRPGQSEAEVYRDPSGFANGLTLDANGNVLACEHGGRRVSRAPYDGEAATVAGSYDGKTLNSPNDLVTHSSGAIYFTDPTYGLPRAGQQRPMGDPEAKQELPFQGVFRVAPDGTTELLLDGFTAPNGLAFSPDESTLYIGDSMDRIIRRYRVAADGSLSGGELFADHRDDDRRGSPDGMKVDEEGRLWTTGAGGVSVYEPDGARLGTFEMEEHAANLAFGGPDCSTLYLTAATSVYSVETAVRGIGPGSRD